MKPTIGRIVIFNVSEQIQKEFGKNCNDKKQLPAIITAVWSETLVNLQVIVDGMAGSYWVTTVDQGDGERQWNWPVIEK
jgi:hypothetical protein